MTNAASKPSRKIQGVVAAIVTLLALAVLVYTLKPPMPRLDRAPFQELGRRLGREAAQLQPPANRIILITRETAQFKTPAYAAMAEGFSQALAQAGAKPATVRVLKVDPLRVVSVPSGEYLELFRKLEDQDIIVSLLGPPQFDAGQLAAVGPRRPRVLAVCSGTLPRQVDLKHLFEDRLLHAAIISRTDAAPGAHDFDSLFKVITAANLSELPAPLAALP